MSCGGGVWSPSGPTLRQGEDDFELGLPTGNGQLDLGRRDYANTLMRVPPGLAFDPGCDPDACADLADPGAEGSQDGLLYLVRVSDGVIADRGALDGPGHKYIEPGRRPAPLRHLVRRDR